MRRFLRFPLSRLRWLLASLLGGFLQAIGSGGTDDWREALSDQVWERYFFNESRDPVQREIEQDKLISRAKLAHEQQRFNPDMVILADVNAQPSHISKPLMQRIEYFSSLGKGLFPLFA